MDFKESGESKAPPLCLQGQFRSEDGRFGASFSSVAISKLLSECKKAGHLETGGILIGKYNSNHDHALASEVTGPPKDSKQEPANFERGTEGVAKLLAAAFKKTGDYYLGEWHFHPYASPTPSSTDRRQLKEIAAAPGYKCPEPLMLIIGGDPENELEARVFLHSEKTGPIELARFNSKTDEQST